MLNVAEILPMDLNKSTIRINLNDSNKKLMKLFQ
jgi:hypothetical protein